MGLQELAVPQTMTIISGAKYQTGGAECSGSAGILPAVLEFQGRARSLRDTGAANTIASTLCFLREDN
jgi:hypothetical protein